MKRIYNKVEDYFTIDNTKNHELITYIGSEVDESYRKTVNTIRINPELKGNFKVVYTPLHGTGQVFAVDVLRENGFDCYPVLSQMTNDPNFSGVKSSNPENPDAFIEAIAYAKEIGAKLVLATDPDADRLGMGILHNGEYILLNGNESATVMVDYICSQLKARGELPENGWVYSTNVSGSLPLKIAESYGLSTYTSLTGFKFIGEQAHKVKAKGGVYVYGYEESYGCLIKDFVRDKDAIQAILMICEIAAWCETQGMDIIDYLESIQAREGYFCETQENIYLRGLEGKEKINKIMETFRHEEVNLRFAEIIKKEDNQLKIAYTYEKNKVLTSVSLIVYALTSIILLWFTFDITAPIFNGEENAGLGLAFGIIIYIVFAGGATILYLISTILSIVSAVSVKKNGESKGIFITNIIFAILPLITLLISIFIILLFVCIGINFPTPTSVLFCSK